MMKAKLLLQVDSLEQVETIYISRLGWRAFESDVSLPMEMGMLEIVPEYPVLFINREKYQALKQQGKQMEELQNWLAASAHRPKQGDSIYVGVSSIAEMEKSLRMRGWDEFSRDEDPGSIRKLLVPIPNEYLVVYWEELFPSHEEILDRYARGADELEAAIQGLTNDQLDHRGTLGKWSIREQLLHVVDLELITIHKVKFALAEPGRSYQGNPFSQDDWSVGLSYAKRSIETELLLFRTIRAHILGLCGCLPDALERRVITSAREESVGQLLKMMSGHAYHHIRAIQRIRQLHRE
ncbi:DinB family protein [Paenibacillus hexagrammi]|uniref:DinB family protein n=1 Tax=Paenibacillus hexagrammi TaxID=2908839 RepID=A0ABY3SU51_9BACL|nr:DinB family protein [Paenibacillus sp. YPD9-1]UJF36477.1 DinB family protein [Paenibacillus sp. YPD9-1]